MKETMKMKLLNDSQFTENVWLKKEELAGVSHVPVASITIQMEF